jgi:hypothetical protein
MNAQDEIRKHLGECPSTSCMDIGHHHTDLKIVKRALKEAKEEINKEAVMLETQDGIYSEKYAFVVFVNDALKILNKHFGSGKE